MYRFDNSNIICIITIFGTSSSCSRSGQITELMSSSVKP